MTVSSQPSLFLLQELFSLKNERFSKLCNTLQKIQISGQAEQIISCLLFSALRLFHFPLRSNILYRVKRTHLALFMAHSQVLPTSMGGRQHTHRHPPQHMSADQLPDRLALVTTVVHADVLKSTFLRAKSWDLSH